MTHLDWLWINKVILYNIFSKSKCDYQMIFFSSWELLATENSKIKRLAQNSRWSQTPYHYNNKHKHSVPGVLLTSMYIISFNSHNSIRQVLLLSSFYRLKQQRLKTTKLLQGHTASKQQNTPWIQAVWLQSPSSLLYTLYCFTMKCKI